MEVNGNFVTINKFVPINNQNPFILCKMNTGFPGPKAFIFFYFIFFRFNFQKVENFVFRVVSQ